MTETVRAVIAGRVQGVGYRAWTMREAARLELAGWVRNKRDSRVEAVFSGDALSVAAMLAACRIGPPMAEVDAIEPFTFEEPVAAGFEQLPTA